MSFSMNSSSRIRGLTLAVVLAALGVASLGVTQSAQAATWVACSQPSVSGPVRAADGRIYVRGQTSGCTSPYRIQIMLKRYGVVHAQNTKYFWSGFGSAAVFSPVGCVRGAGYQGVALVSAYYNNRWNDVTYATSGAPRALC